MTIDRAHADGAGVDVVDDESADAERRVGDVAATIAGLVERLAEERRRDLSATSGGRRARAARRLRAARVDAAVDPGALRDRVQHRARLALADTKVRRLGGVTRLVRRSSWRTFQAPPTPSSRRARRQRYVIHVGAPKCGSTYLQSLLWQNRVALADDDVYVPGTTQGDHFLAGSDVLGAAATPEAAASDGWRGAWERLIDDAERSGRGTVVISDETLCRATAGQARRALDRLDGHEVHVVYAMRELAGLLPSQWQSGALWGPVPSFERWLRDRVLERPGHWFWESHDVERVLRHWQVDDPHRLHVVIVPSNGDDDELWRRFQSVVGWTVPTTTDGPRSNASIGFSQIELLRRVQQRLSGGRADRLIRRRITEAVVGLGVLARQPHVDTPLIPLDLSGRIEELSRTRRDVITASGAHVVGDVHELANPPGRFSATPAVPDPELMLAAGRAVIDTLERHLAAHHRPASAIALAGALVGGRAG